MDQNRRAWVMVIGILAILTFGVFSVVQTLRSATNSVLQPLQFSNDSLQTQVAQVLHPTPTVIPDPVTIIHEVKPLARLESIQYTVEKVITAETAQGPFGFLFGDKLILVAHGTVVAGVDLSQIKAEDIAVENGILTIKMPGPEIFSVSVNNQKSYIYNRTTGVLTHGDVNLETTARRAAEDQIRQAAIDDGILEQAQVNAQNVLNQFLSSLGYKDVIFIQPNPL
jgi:hypothetical protein